MVIKFLQAIGSTIPAKGNKVDTSTNWMREEESDPVASVNKTKPIDDLGEFPELVSDEPSKISGNISQPTSEGMLENQKQSKNGSSQYGNNKLQKKKITTNDANCTRKSKRTRRIPKVFTPNSSEGSVYCLCQQEDRGWYLVCSFRFPGCLLYYHPKCVGLDYLKSKNEGDLFSNCDDGESYICPICKRNNKTVHKHVAQLSFCTDHASGNEDSNQDFDRPEKDCSTGTPQMIDTGDPTFEVKNEETTYFPGAKDPTFLSKFLDGEELNSNSYNHIDRTSCIDRSSENEDSEQIFDCPEKNPSTRAPQCFSDGDKARLVGIDTKKQACEVKKEETTDFPDENDPIILSKILEDDEWNSDNYDRMDWTSESMKRTNNTSSINNLPISHDTLSRMMDCPGLPTTPFFTADPPKEAQFKLSEDEWNRIKPIPGQEHKLQKSWTDIVARHIAKSNAYCTFHFNRHFIQKPNSRKRQYSYEMKADGFCIFDECECKFNLFMTKKNFEEKILTVTYDGFIKHAAGERHSRFIKGDERKELQKQFHKGPEKPSLVYQAKKAELPGDAMASGNRTGCGLQTTTMRKIASEGRQLLQMDKDITKSLEKIRQMLIEKESARDCPPNPGHGGFVHTICYHPLIVHMWIEDQVRLWHRRCADDISYLDATGSIVANHNGKRVLYYGLVVRHPNEGDPSVAVAEMITSDQSTGNIRFFIERFRRDESRIYSGRLTSPRQLNTDYSKAILLAVLKEFNNETLEAFFQRAFRILNKEGTEQDFELTIPHVGCSHFMHIVHKKIKELSRSKEEVWYRFNMYCVSLLVNARTLYEFDTIFEDVVICLSSKKQTKILSTAYQRLSGRINNMKKDCEIDLANFEKEIEDVTLQSHEEDIACKAKRGNPFNNYFDKKLHDIEIRKDAVQVSNREKDNRSYCPEFLLFIKKYVVEMPLWSGVLLGRLERYRDDCNEKRQIRSLNQFLSFSSANAKTEGYIEGAMRNLKQEDFTGRKRLRADTFVSENYTRIRRRLSDYGDRLHTRLISKTKRAYNKKTKKDNDVDNLYARIGSSSSSEENYYDAQEKGGKNDSETPKQNPKHDRLTSKAKRPYNKKTKKHNEVDNLYARIGSSSSSEENYHDAQEKWGKKDPETPKQNPKFEQFQQSPTIPLSEAPDFKKPKPKRKAHSSLPKTRCSKANDSTNSSDKTGKKLAGRTNKLENDTSSTSNKDDREVKCTPKSSLYNKRRRKPRLTAKEKEREKKWTEWIYKHDADKEENDKEEPNRKRKGPSTNSPRSKRKKFNDLINSLDDQETYKQKFVGLHNRRNSCWLNTLVQCNNSLPLRLYLLDEIKNTPMSRVTSALTNVISKMDYASNATFYPIELHQAIEEEYSLSSGEQQDILEIFTLICSTDMQNTNSPIASHFQIGSQFSKMCRECGYREDNTPETYTSVILPVLNGIQDLERSIENNMNDHINIHCGSCNKITEHARSGKFVFLPQSLVIGFNRFDQNGATLKKKHSKAQLPLELDVTGNTMCRYSLRVCALHHGQTTHSGHYTATIFDKGRVIEIDDHVVKDITENWVYQVQSTVYLAFYTKKYSLINYIEQQETSPHSGNDTDRKKKNDTNEQAIKDNDKANQRNSTNFENITRCYDISSKYQAVCTTQSVGYELLGSNFKTLEFPVRNKSYSINKPGWLDDSIIDAYLLLLVKSCEQKNIRVHALNSFFYTRLQRALLDLIKEGNEKKIQDMVTRSRDITDFEACDYVLIPVNSNAQHWTAVFIDIWNGSMFYYDPFTNGMKNETVVKSIKFFFAMLYEFRKTCDIRIGTAGFITGFKVTWEETFPCQKDCCSCGVFVLMYMSYRLGMLTFDVEAQSISSIRNEIAEELLSGVKKQPLCRNAKAGEMLKRCFTATRYKQQLEKTVVLYCSTSEGLGKNFIWTHNDREMCKEQLYKFQLTEEKVGTYWCHVRYADVDILAASCEVQCGQPKPSDESILNEMKMSIQTVVGKK